MTTLGGDHQFVGDAEGRGRSERTEGDELRLPDTDGYSQTVSVATQPDDVNSGHTWLDAFPWLKAVEPADNGLWWNEDINDDGEARNARLARVADLAIQRLANWPISQIYPGLDPRVNLVTTQLPVRALNVLTREGVSEAGGLLSMTPSDLMRWRNVGALTIDAIMRKLADISTSSPAPSIFSHSTANDATGARGSAAPVAEWTSSVFENLASIAKWYVTIGMIDRPLLGEPLPPVTPPDVVAARSRLEALAAYDIAAELSAKLSVAGQFNEAIGRLDARAIAVLRNRLFAEKPATLEDIAQTFDVTRERIRQLEGKARGSLLSVVSDDGALSDAARTVREMIDVILPLDLLIEQIPALSEEVELVAQPAWRVLDRLDDAYEIIDGWCGVPTMSAAEAYTAGRLQEIADSRGVLRLSDVSLVNAPSQSEAEAANRNTQWLTRCGYVIYGDWVFVRTQNIGDYAAAILAAEGNPLTPEQILERFQIERAKSSLTNALASDERFERVDRDMWGLKEWGMDAYTGIRSLIRQELGRRGGQMALSDLVETLTSKYTITASSVTSYASSRPFEIRNGVVRSSSADQTIKKAPEHTRRLFRRDGSWVYRISVNADHLRGSGSFAPVALASICKIAPAEAGYLDSKLGPQAIAWRGNQPMLGSIRRFLLEDDVAAGTEAFLVFGDDLTFDFEVARARNGDPLADALALAGCARTSSSEEARRALARAIKLSPDSPSASLVAGYRERGDEDIADLLLAAHNSLASDASATTPRQDADVDEIMDML